MVLTRDTIQAFLAVVSRGVGQVMFQGHAGTGLFFLAGIAMASPWMLLGAVVGALIGPVTAYACGFDREETRQGLYGFNSSLVGLAALVFLKPGSVATWILLVAGCAAASVVTFVARKYVKFPTYTAPFVVVTWAILLTAHGVWGHAIDAAPAPAAAAGGGFFREILRGEAEVMFGAGAVTGILFLIGIALSNPAHAAMALLGSVVGTLIGHYHGDSANAVSLGIDGYNGALAAMALFLNRRTLTLPILAAILATLITEFFPKGLNLPALTGPFVAGSWGLLAILWLEKRLFPEAHSPGSPGHS